MKLPRWTVYPALALLAAMLVLAFPHPQEDVHRGAASDSRREAAVERRAARSAVEDATDGARIESQAEAAARASLERARAALEHAEAPAPAPRSR